LTAKSLEYELNYLQAGVDSLEKYLLSDELFWPLNAKVPDGAPEYPRLTLGGLLMAREKVKAYSKQGSLEDNADKAIADLDRVRAQWRMAWENKARLSFSMRLRMWGDYLGEYRNNAQDNADRYPYEVRLRVMLQLLSIEFAQTKPAETELWRALDGYLKGVFMAGAFIWEPEIQPGFPVGPYWYLYGKLPVYTK
jgi:hypothetical protein